MENKQLQIAKDTIAKKYGYVNFEQFDDKSTFGYNHNTLKIIDEISIEYHRLMSEDDGIEQKSEIFTRSGSVLSSALDIESQMNDFIKKAKPNIISIHNSYENEIRTMVVIYKPLPQPPK